MGKMVEESRRRREQFIEAGRASKLRYEKPKPEDTYLKGAAFGTMDMKERLQLLDKEGMAKTILYPTIGLLWECETMDADLSAAYATAYNRWIADFCRGSRAGGWCRSRICRWAIRKRRHASSSVR
jgi:hypothetical protein